MHCWRMVKPARMPILRHVADTWPAHTHACDSSTRLHASRYKPVHCYRVLRRSSAVVHAKAVHVPLSYDSNTWDPAPAVAHLR